MLHLSRLQKKSAYELVTAFLEESHEHKLRKQSWNRFREELQKGGYEETFRNAVLLWTMENLAHHRKDHFRYRILHEMEKEIITPEAYGLLIKSMHLGIIDLMQSEFIIEDAASRENHPVSYESIRNLITRSWLHNIERSGTGRPN
jgi:hypothetical protein